MYMDEEIVLDLRLHILDEYVDYFVIVESLFNHRGEKRKLKFNLNKYKQFKKKIIYIVYKEPPHKIEKIDINESEENKSIIIKRNAYFRESGQRDYIIKGLTKASDNDLILISDVDEIPNLKNLNLNNVKKKIFFFRQDMYYYKFNLKLPNFKWIGTRACKRKDLLSPQWLRNIRNKKYPIYRIDALFSKRKYTNIQFIKNGGWHFSNIKKAEEIRYKLKSYLHHREFDLNPLSVKEIDEIIKKKKAVYDLKVDKKVDKIGGTGVKLIKHNLKKLPKYLQKNINKYKKWID
jgi:beta-1,4-mannosyl-glycoprotein beta-1,4-N-acetylglucosaminyltransferase